MNIGRKGRALVLLAILALVGLGLTFVLGARRTDVARQLVIATGSTNRSWVVTAEGTNMLLRLDNSAIPILLGWSRGRDPVWYKWANPVRKLLRLPPIQSTYFSESEMARRAFAVLRERATAAVPKLVRQLSDPDPNARRTSVHMLGAIGPAIGSQAFHQMTNCLSDSNREVRNDVVWAIQFHRPEEYPAQTLLAIYTAGLQDSYNVAGQNAIIGLTRLPEGTVSLRKIIESALKNPDPDVRFLAQQWLLGKPTEAK